MDTNYQKFCELKYKILHEVTTLLELPTPSPSLFLLIRKPSDRTKHDRHLCRSAVADTPGVTVTRGNVEASREEEGVHRRDIVVWGASEPG